MFLHQRASAAAARPIAGVVDLADEETLERVAKLPAHGAVDEERHRIAEEYEEVDEQRRRLCRRHVEDRQFERLVDDEHDEDDGERKFDDEKDADDGDQHQRRRVAVRQPAALRLPVQLEEDLASALRGAHRVQQERVEDDEHRARYEVDEDDAETVVDAEDDVLIDGDDRGELDGAAGDVALRVDERRNDDRSVDVLEEATGVRQEGDDLDGDDGANDVGHRAPALGGDRVAHVDVTLDGERHRQPDGRPA